MPSFVQFIKKELKPNYAAIRQNRDILRDRDSFKPHGIQVFFGEQGSGKTLTAKNAVDIVLAAYPKCLLVSNVGIKDRKGIVFNADVQKLLRILDNPKLDPTKHYISFSNIDEYEMVLRYVKRGKYGRLIFVDEIQNYFNNQESKNVPMWVIEQSAQNRKQKTLVIATSQDYDQIAKPIRRRTDLAIKCATFSIPLISHGSIFTTYKAYNSKNIDFKEGKLIGDRPLKTGFYFHSKKLRDSFDTLQVIFTGKEGHDIYSEQAFDIQKRLLLSLANTTPSGIAKNRKK